MLENAEFDIYEDDKILKFFKFLLTERRHYSHEDVESLVKDCLKVASVNECNQKRVLEVMKFLRKLSSFLIQLKIVK